MNEIEKLINQVKEDFIELEANILTLVGRLYDEDDNTFAPETRAVMAKWKPVFKRKFLKNIEGE